MNKKLGLVAALSICMFIGCKTEEKSQPSSNTLREAYKDIFLIGAAIDTTQIEEKDPQAAALIPAQFSAVTPENIMKSEILQPAWEKFDFTWADKLVAYAEKHGLKINAHTLVWHSQLPPFMANMQDADSVKAFFTNHINTVAKRYAGKVFSWDVVNEALEEDGSLRKSIFLEKLGEDYIVEAFRLAQQADPNAELYYNDYNIEQPKKRAGAIAIIKKIQAAGVRIDGVGIQGHWRAYKVPFKDIEESIQEFSALGLKVMFTELDLGVIPNPWDGDAAEVSLSAEYNEKMNPYAAGLPDSMVQIQTKAYTDLFNLFLKYKDKVSRVTVWGVHDAQSWLNDWPIKGRTNYPLLFDRSYNAKPAVDSIIAITRNIK